jgi:hypothetical protein
MTVILCRRNNPVAGAEFLRRRETPAGALRRDTAGRSAAAAAWQHKIFY